MNDSSEAIEVSRDLIIEEAPVEPIGSISEDADTDDRYADIHEYRIPCERIDMIYVFLSTPWHHLHGSHCIDSEMKPLIVVV